MSESIVTYGYLHLGNVLAVVTDKKLPTCSTTVITGYTADVINQQDYSPFGAPLADRTYDAIKEANRNILVKNTFTSTVESWAGTTGSAATVSVVSGQLKVAYTATTQSARLYASVFNGKNYLYKVKVDFGTGTVGTAPMELYVKDATSGTKLCSLVVSTGGTYTLKFKATSGGAYLQAGQSGTLGANKFFYIDDVVLEEDKILNPAYRYGFNGQEKDDETYGSGNEYDFGERMYDPRLGRWLSVDKKFKDAPNWSPYRYAFDNPIQWKDNQGNYEEDGHYWTVLLVATMLKQQDAKQIAEYAELPDHRMNADGSIQSATNTWTKVPWQKEVHALTGGDIGKERALAMQKLKEANTTMKKGMAAHEVGDSYAHSDDLNGTMYSPGVGHLFEGHTPDKISDNPDKYLSYVGALTEGLGGEGAQIDNTAFNYIANAGLDTKANNEILKSEYNLITGQKSFTIASDQKDAVNAYLKERSGNGKFNYTMTTSKDDKGNETTTVNYSPKDMAND